jgi:hypothetical protein
MVRLAAAGHEVEFKLLSKHFPQPVDENKRLQPDSAGPLAFEMQFSVLAIKVSDWLPLSRDNRQRRPRCPMRQIARGCP